MAPSTDSKLVVKTAVLSAVFTVVLFMLVNYYFNHSLNPFVITQSKTQPLIVQGTGTVNATPDNSQVNFNVSKTAVNEQDAQTQANTFTNTIVNDLQKVGIDKNDIQTSNYDSSPNYDNNGNTIISYTVNEDVTITVRDVSKANSVIDTATKDGAENVSGPMLSFSDAKQKDLMDQARVKAVTDARQKAQSIAQAAGIHLGKLLSIHEDNQPQYPIIRPLPMVQAAGGIMRAPTKINTGQNSVTDNVTLSYETY